LRRWCLRKYPQLEHHEKDHQMSLTFTGESIATTNGTDYRATGSRGESIVVEASHEALQVHGVVAVQQKAVAKYEEEEMFNNKVTVGTADFR
jgi:hypothetical protein